MGAQVEEGMHGEEARRKLEHEVLEHKTNLAALSALLKATRKELFLQQEACEQQRGLLVAANKTIKQHKQQRDELLAKVRWLPGKPLKPPLSTPPCLSS